MEHVVGGQFQVRRRSCSKKKETSKQQGDDLERRAARPEMKVALGELSSARQAFEGDEVAPCDTFIAEIEGRDEAPTSST